MLSKIIEIVLEAIKPENIEESINYLILSFIPLFLVFPSWVGLSNFYPYLIMIGYSILFLKTLLKRDITLILFYGIGVLLAYLLSIELSYSDILTMIATIYAWIGIAIYIGRRSE